MHLFHSKKPGLNQNYNNNRVYAYMCVSIVVAVCWCFLGVVAVLCCGSCSILSLAALKEQFLFIRLPPSKDEMEKKIFSSLFRD